MLSLRTRVSAANGREAGSKVKCFSLAETAEGFRIKAVSNKQAGVGPDQLLDIGE
jgi:hypothetical protein